MLSAVCNGAQRQHNKKLNNGCQSYTKYYPNETTGCIFVSWQRNKSLQNSTVGTVTGTIFLIPAHIIPLVQGQGRWEELKLNQAVSERLLQLLAERNMTQYQLYMKSGVPKSTISNIINCSYDSVKLRIIHEICQGMEIGLDTFFVSPLFQEDNLDP